MPAAPYMVAVVVVFASGKTLAPIVAKVAEVEVVVAGFFV
jgi:hypothetical protein